MNRFKFSDVFQENPDGSLTPKIRISVNGVSFGPGGMTFNKGVAFGGIDFHQYKNLDIAGEYVDDILLIKGFFN